jgi:2-oxoglutarate ferredoxin oxidoreductase subunit alpha
MMSEKRARKYREAAKEPGFTARFGEKKAELGVIGWGSTQGAIREGVEMARKAGLSVAQLQLKMVYPLPESDIREFLNSVERVMVAELNFSGQLNQMIRAQFSIPTISFTKCEGLPFFSEEVLAKIQAVASGEKAAAEPATARHR